MRRLTVLTDFGTADGYVAAMKGVVASLAPLVLLDDAGHEIPQGDVARAAWALAGYWSRFPEGTVHLVVVDPGVGTERRPLAVEADGRFVVAPDNGVVSRVLADASRWSAVEVDPERLPVAESSATFHGRDLFAPAAALLAAGRALGELGRPLSEPVLLREPEPRRHRGGIEGDVVVQDRFGNLITNIPGEWVRTGMPVRVSGRSLEVRNTYGEVESGALLALVNSAGRLEVAVRDGSAARELDAEPGLPVKVIVETAGA
ncbi:MAG: hypothetical protein GWM92_13030 [Gemmatimonadetes bacterium]|nr:SAM-dependent chlorinase/fluorinase [Gemmatimonadota bacterium]NIR77371.1 SAM-dependent chlorinase/fluorinase [Gemmatimonadota bacterium]NIT88316.1 SAM-dependent chlorinase/fluorinase [Gemmatimonadota bacterium]NIU32129.1 SAM-dependent chlorinase/fluorinase [Gemmatimonadota bacterium]NIU34750.1 hypothetical protein [Gemmatimonadota bacterium]